jgi:integrase
LPGEEATTMGKAPAKPRRTKSTTLRPTGGVSIVRRGDKYYIRYVDHEDVRRMRFVGTTVEEARDRARTVADDVESDRQAALLGVPIGRESLRFWEFVKEYRPVLGATMRPATLRVIDTQIVAFDKFLKTRGDPTIDRVTRADVDSYVAQEAARGCASTYISRQVWALERLWRGAVERGHADENPFSGRKFDRTTKYEVPYVTAAQLAAIIDAVTPRHRDIIALVAATGVRIGEAIGLAWSDCDLDAKQPQIHVSRQGPERELLKTPAARRTIPLQPPAAEMLCRRRDASSEGAVAVFLDVDTRQDILRSLHAACRATKAPRLRLHDLRHVFASHLVQAGVPMTTVARLLGHADGGALVAKRYGRWQPQDAEALAMVRLMKFRSTKPAKTR